MTEPTTILFVHGDGGPNSDKWVKVLDDTLRSLGFDSATGGQNVTIVAPRYDDVFHDPAPSAPIERTVSPRPDRDRGRFDYEVNKDAVHRRLAPMLTPGGSGLPGNRVIPEVAEEFFDHVKPFRHSRDARRRAIRRVVSAAPTRGRVVLVGYSLGSAVALAALTRLPEDVEVPLFLTIGSPLALDTFARHLKVEGRDYFPYDRVGLWANAYGSRDPVTMGRGVAAAYQPALDLGLPAWIGHGADEYLGHPAIATLLGETLFGARPTSNEVARTDSTDVVPRVHPGVVSVLIRFQWLHAWKDWAANHEHPRLRARLVRAIDLIATDVEQRYAALGEFVDEPLPRLPDLRRESALNLSALAIDKRAMLAQLVFLSLQTVEAPYRVGEHGKASWTHCRTRTWTAAYPALAGDAEAKRVSANVRQARDEAEGCFSGGGRLAPWLGFAGLAVLAATGVGLAVAVPAGLAGAAAITATLAAFGPGGMLGGIATIAALTGAGSAMVASAATMGSASAQLQDGRDAERRAALEQTVALSPPEFRSVLVSLMATARATQLEGMAHPGDETWTSLTWLEGECARELAIHELVDDDERGSPMRSWATKLEDVRKAIRWMESRQLQPEGISLLAIEGE